MANKYTTKYVTADSIPEIGGMLAQELNDAGNAARKALESEEVPEISGILRAISADSKACVSLHKLMQVHKVSQAIFGGDLSTYTLIIEVLDMGISIGMKMAADRALAARTEELAKSIPDYVHPDCPDCGNGTRYPTLGADYVEVAGVVTEARCVTCGREVK